MYSIYIVEDDPKIAEILENHLKKYHYTVYIAQDFEKIKQEYQHIQPHVTLMDINLPYFDGFYWCRQIRTLTNNPIIFISARTDELNQVMAIEYGADDYITKPFHLEVVIAKIKSAVRRAFGEYAIHNSETTQINEYKGLYLYPEKLQVEWQEVQMQLSHKEFLLLQALVKKGGQVVSRDELLEALWDEIAFVDDNTLTVNVTRVRKKLEELHLKDAIHTIRGQGYQLKMVGDDEK